MGDHDRHLGEASMTRPLLSRYVAVDTSPARVARLWQDVSLRLDSAPGSTRRWLRRGGAALVLATAAAVGAAATFVVAREPAPSAWQHAALETASDTLSVDLDDGSRMQLGAHTRVEVVDGEAAAVQVELAHGSVECDVVIDRGRRFSVFAAGVEVRVTGTRFRVELDGRRLVHVEVKRGSVEVVRPGGSAPERRLAAGERWSLDLAQAEAAASAPQAREPVPAPQGVDDGSKNSARGAPGHQQAVPGAAPKPEPASARELLDRGNAARRAGDVAAAARAYDILLNQHPSDPRAGLAAFELGRLRMDRLGDLAGAVQALNRAVALAPGSGFREDAMARLVDAHANMGAGARCRAAQAAYLRSYPQGVHASVVARRCAPSARAAAE
jgi:transmembrane sensor